MSSQSNSPFGPPEDFLIAAPTSELLITCSLIGLPSLARVFFHLQVVRQKEEQFCFISNNRFYFLIRSRAAQSMSDFCERKLLSVAVFLIYCSLEQIGLKSYFNPVGYSDQLAVGFNFSKLFVKLFRIYIIYYLIQII